MARLSSFVYCLNAEKPTDGRGTTNAFGLLSDLRPQFVPGVFSFSIAVSVLALGIDSQDATIRVAFFESGSDAPIVDSGEICIPHEVLEARDAEIPDEFQGLDLTMDMRNVLFKSEGEYLTKVYFDGDCIGEQPIYVKGAENHE